MMNSASRKNKIISIIINILALLLCMAVAFAVCTAKQGLHEDEYYSFYSSNRTDGLWPEGDVKNETLLNELRVIEGEGFNFSLVKEVQSWDVHPPVYYFILHLVCSFKPGIFSMWQGLIINLLAFMVACILMKWLGTILLPGRDLMVTLMVVAWAVSAATLTGLVFIRMYMLLTVWVLAITILHILAKDKWGVGFYITLAILTFIGFMTHYYFFIWLFFLAIGMNIWRIVKKKNISGTLIYGLVMVAVFALCYVFYSAWPGQMFKGQRGAQATGNFFDLSNTVERICFFAEKINRIGFGYTLGVLIIVMVVLGLYQKSKKKIVWSDTLIISVILSGALVCYFATVSKTALMLGDSSIRYQMPVLGVAYMVVLTLFACIVGNMRGMNERMMTICCSGLAVIILVANVLSCASGNVSFLYPEEAKHLSLVNSYSDASILYVFDSANEWCIWDSANELVTHEYTSFAPGDDLGRMDETKAIGADSILLYVDTAVEIDPVLHHITQVNDKISTFEYLFSNEYCDVYIGE